MFPTLTAAIYNSFKISDPFAVQFAIISFSTAATDIGHVRIC